MIVDRPRPRNLWSAGVASCAVTLRGGRASPRYNRRDYISAPWPEWRNGRRNGLKIRRGQPHESSTLSSGIGVNGDEPAPAAVNLADGRGAATAAPDSSTSIRLHPPRQRRHSRDVRACCVRHRGGKWSGAAPDG